MVKVPQKPILLSHLSQVGVGFRGFPAFVGPWTLVLDDPPPVVVRRPDWVDVAPVFPAPVFLAPVFPWPVLPWPVTSARRWAADFGGIDRGRPAALSLLNRLPSDNAASSSLLPLGDVLPSTFGV